MEKSVDTFAHYSNTDVMCDSDDKAGAGGILPFVIPHTKTL